VIGSRSRDTAAAGLILAPLLVLLALMVGGQFADPDLWGRLSIATVLFQTGHLPRIDDFSYTANGAPWIDHEWLTGVAFYAALRAGGEAGLMLLKYALAASTLLLVFALHRIVYRRSPQVACAALLLLLPVYLPGFMPTLRAQVFSFAFFLAFAFLLEAIRFERLREIHLVWLVPVGVVWGNLHGGVAMGILLIGVYALAEVARGRVRLAVRRAATAVALLAALSLLNPYGPRYMGFLVRAWTLDRSAVGEWFPLLELGWNVVTAILILSTGLAGGLAIGGLWSALRRRPDGASDDLLAPSLALALLVCMTLSANRIAIFLGLGLAAYLPVFLGTADGGKIAERAPRPLRTVLRWLPTSICVVALAGAVRYAQAMPVLATIVPDETLRVFPAKLAYPAGAARYLASSPYEGKLMGSFRNGEFLYFTLYPKFRVAIDGRYEEVYAQDALETVVSVYTFDRRQPEQAIAAANRTGADFIIYRSSTPNPEIVARSPQWRRVYDDGVFSVIGHERALGTGPLHRVRPLGMYRRRTIRDFFSALARSRFEGYPITASPEAGP
jgi:hypothetical protein